MKWEDYGQIVHVANAVRHYLGQSVYHEADEQVMNWLNAHHYRCVVVLLVDALGSSVLERHCSVNGFFRSHVLKNISTVFPPTTTAATTSLRTGKYPKENAWLGWDQYFREKEDEIILFMNRGKYSGKKYPGFVSSALPVSFLEEEMKGQAETIWPKWGPRYPSENYEAMWKNIVKVSSNTENRYVYAYYDALDTFMHIHGPSCKETGDYVLQLEKITEAYARQLPEDVGVCLLADHSQIEVHAVDLEKYPSICRCLTHLPTLEPRACGFRVKEDRKEEFLQEFNRYFKDAFTVYTRQEILEMNIFGKGKENIRFREFVPDYLAVARSDISLVYHSPEQEQYLHGDHAGGLQEEALVPVILI